MPRGAVLTGGFEFELTLSNGGVKLEEIDILKASDDTPIYPRSCGVAPPGSSDVRVVPDFEVATSSSLAGLNTTQCAATRVVDSAAGSITLAVYDMTDVEPGQPSIKVTEPAGERQQPWNRSTATGSQGTSVFTDSGSGSGGVSITFHERK